MLPKRRFEHHTLNRRKRRRGPERYGVGIILIVARRGRSSLLPLKLARRLAEFAPHPVCHVRLMCEARRKCHLAGVELALQQKDTGPLDPAPHDVTVNGRAGLDLEPVPQMGAARTGNSREPHQRKRLFQMCFDIVEDALQLRRRQTTRCGRYPLRQAKQLRRERDADAVDEQASRRHRGVLFAFQRPRQMGDPLVFHDVTRTQPGLRRRVPHLFGDPLEQAGRDAQFQHVTGGFGVVTAGFPGRHDVDVGTVTQMASSGLPA